MSNLSHVGKTIYLAADHAGYEYKQAVYDWLQTEKWEVIDCGATEYDAEDDFPELIAPAAQAVAVTPTKACAVVFGGSGQGEAMVSNRFPGVRATVYYGGPDEILTLSRQHNDANVLSIGARFVELSEVKRVIWLWLHADASPTEKYQRRNQALDSNVSFK